MKKAIATALVSLSVAGFAAVPALAVQPGPGASGGAVAPVQGNSRERLPSSRSVPF